MSQPLTPINPSDRVSVIDALRGFAILGILFMNVKASSFPFGFEDLSVLRLDWILDKITYWGLEFLISGKFFTMFTFLFGLGMAVQMSRAIAKDNEKKFPMVYIRRLLLLLIIGFIHDVFVWDGWVLLWYPVVGFPLLLFRKFKPRLMLTMVIFLMLLMAGASTLQVVLSRPAPPPEQQVRQTTQKQETTKTDEQKELEGCNAVIKIYKEGSYIDIVKDRLAKVPSTFRDILFAGWYILGMFMLGTWTWRKGIFHDIKKHGKFLKTILLYSLIIGIVFTTTILLLRIWGNINSSPLWMHFLIVVVEWTGYAALTAFYVSGFLLLYPKAFFQRLVKPIEAVGRAALNNYIFQNIIVAFIFYSYGLKLFGDTLPLVNLLICFPIFAIQIPLSVWWMRRYRFGPVEWLWRTLTYGKRQPMRIKKEV